MVPVSLVVGLCRSLCGRTGHELAVISVGQKSGFAIKTFTKDVIDPNRLPSVRPSFNSGESQWTMPLKRTYLRSHGFASAEHSDGAAALMRIKDG